MDLETETVKVATRKLVVAELGEGDANQFDLWFEDAGKEFLLGRKNAWVNPELVAAECALIFIGSLYREDKKYVENALEKIHKDGLTPLRVSVYYQAANVANFALIAAVVLTQIPIVPLTLATLALFTVTLSVQTMMAFRTHRKVKALLAKVDLIVKRKELPAPDEMKRLENSKNNK